MVSRWDSKWIQTVPAWYAAASGRVPDCTRYMGHACAKNPLDAWAYQEIIFDNTPDVIIETGTYAGGSALYLSHVMQNAGIENPLVITIDISQAGSIHVLSSNILKIEASSESIDAVKAIEAALDARGPSKIMMILDSDHEYSHVLDELHALTGFVTRGQYLIVEDADAVEGPWIAVNEWLPNAPDFERTARYEDKLVWTSNPGGWLIRTRGPERLPVPQSP